MQQTEHGRKRRGKCVASYNGAEDSVRPREAGQDFMPWNGVRRLAATTR
jgi:hypothetical protein